MISVAAVGVLVSVLQSSSKTAAQRSVQQDARVNIEEIARTVRASSIDYAFYKKAEDENQARCAISGYVNETTGTTEINGSIALPLFWSEAVAGGGGALQKRVVFFYDGGSPTDDTDGAIYRYETDAGAPTPSCDDVFGSADKVRLSAQNVAASRMKFFVSPLSSPYKDTCAIKNSLCQVRRNTHPRVTILMTVRTPDEPDDAASQSKFSETTLQTTIGTRAYPITGLVGQ